MLRKKSRPVIGMLAGSLIAGNRSKLMEVTNTARPHLSHTAQSTTGRKSYDFGGVGLGIVAALENSSDAADKVLLIRNLSRSKPITVPSLKNTGKSTEKSDIKACVNGRRGDDRIPFRIQMSRRASVFHISPARFGEAIGIPTSDFLSSCHMCQKKLYGEDIYMYRGEKAFCSTECRYRQIKKDECTEKRSSKASRHADISSSKCANGHIFSSEIFAI